MKDCWRQLAFLFMICWGSWLFFAQRVRGAEADDVSSALSVSGQVGVHETTIPPVRVLVHVYATATALAENPVADVDGSKQGEQKVSVGQYVNGEFVPAVRFGVVDSGAGPGEDHGLLCLWAHDGTLDHFGHFARPQTPFDFRAQLDLNARRATVWTSRRGDDRWFLLLDAVPIEERVTAVDTIRVEQGPGAAGVEDVLVRNDTWQTGEEVRPHPLAKTDRVVSADNGFQFQSMRSTWRTHPGRHVTIARNPPVWFGFPEVVQVGERGLMVAHVDGRAHGGGGDINVRRSGDLGQTWGEPHSFGHRGINCPRIQILEDRSVLVLGDIRSDIVPLHRSTDRGVSWDRIGSLNGTEAGGNPAVVPSRVHELKDGSWLISGAWYPGGKPWVGTKGEYLEIFRSTDRGATWKLHGTLQAYPDHLHSISEPTILTLPDGRLLLFARENRHDGFRGIKAYSSDSGQTWEVQELPFCIHGRTHAGFLPDGRIMLTFRSGIGHQALWAWIGDPLEEPRPSAASGVHYNDAGSVGIKDGELHIDSDGHRGQFTQYYFRPPTTPECSLDITCEAKVTANAGRAATLSIPFCGKLRIYNDHVQLLSTSETEHPEIAIAPELFHTYRAIVNDGELRLSIDGTEVLNTDQINREFIPHGWSPARTSKFGLAIGNERRRDWGNHDQADQHPDVWEPNITPEVTGHSVWRRFEAVVREPGHADHVISWHATRDRFPDQYQLDHIVEIEASVHGHDQGYSGWTMLPDGRVFFVNYTDDTSVLVKPRSGGIGARMGISWIRGTYVEMEELTQ